jgi:hypothetical protein
MKDILDDDGHFWDEKFLSLFFLLKDWQDFEKVNIWVNHIVIEWSEMPSSVTNELV